MAATLRVGGRAVELVRHRADGPPLVLVHGAGGNAGIWAPLARELSAFDLIAPSLPGRGGSEGEAFTRAAAAAAWLAEVLDALGGPPPLVLGHSYGGALVLELALRGVELAGLVLVATGARLRVHPGVLMAAAQAVRTSTPMSSRFAFVGGERGIIDAFAEASDATPPEATERDWQACNDFDRMAALDGLDVPALILGGTSDVLTPPKYHRYLAEHMPRAQLTLMEGRGHMLPWEEPHSFASEVRSFAASC